MTDPEAAGDHGGEGELLAHLRRTLPTAPEGELYLGDDAAVLRPARGRALFAADVVIENVHVDLARSSADDAGWKAIAVNVSDIAAMGGIPTHAVAGVGAPPGADLAGLYRGMRAAAEEYGLFLVGGDLSAAPLLFVSVAVLGETAGAGPVLRSGGRAGDELWCTGPLGASAAGLAALRRPGGPAPRSAALVAAHLRPSARVVEGRLAAELGASAMIDVSDGLARDVAHLAEESRLGVALDSVPVAVGATEEEALGGGEDYELVFSLAPGTPVVEAFAAGGLRPPSRIGRFVDEREGRTLRGGALPALGWEHRL